MPDGDLMFRSAIALAAMVRSGEISSRELVQVSLERIEELNPALNAFVDIDAERALAGADAVKAGDERPFAGVPTAIKNNRPVQGLRLTYGCQLMEQNMCDYDHNVTRRLKEAGFVVVGTTTLPEYGILPTSEARIFGPTRNPWDLGRTPGGSSGGAAAAVASGMLPVAHGNDGGGSVRIPAACCGLVGLKPSRGRISAAPELGDSSLGIDGMLTRTVADTAAILDVLAGYEPGDATWAPAPSESFAHSAAREPGPLRIAATTLAPVPDAPVDPMCVAAVWDAADLLRSLGHQVEEVEPPWQVDGLQALFGAVFSNQIALSIAYSGMVAGRGADGISAEDMEPMSWAIFSMVKRMDAIEGMGAAVQLQAFARRLISFLAPYDVLLTPALAERPLPLGTLNTAAPEPMATFTRSGVFTPFTPVFNAAGQPAISVPLFEGEDGLPLGVQLVGRPVGEGQLLALATQLEGARPWAGRRPLLSCQ
ncbi:MAG TPA: amidase [Solirubrobacteraceae bacterium]|jgi:amidase|nr:amidase [Solirubrobacteraceae bacterium]